MKEDLPQRGASAGHERKQLVAWLEHHRDTLKDSSARLLSAPFSTLLTVLVLAVAMALPAGLYVLLDNVRRVTEGMESASQITLYLKESLPPQRQELLLKQLNQDSRFGQIQLISSDQALQEFREYSGWGDVLDYLDTNPLPAVVVVRPLMTDTQPDEMERWLDDLRRLPDVESVQLDMQWVRRLYSLYDLLERGVAALALLYGLWIALDALLFGVSVAGWPTLAAGIMLFSGVQLMSIGILGEYIGRIYDEVKQRPTYVVARDEDRSPWRDA